MEIKELIEYTKKIDIKQDDWVEDVKDKIEDPYCQGYIARCIEELGNEFCSDDEEYRGVLVDYLNDFVKG